MKSTIVTTIIRSVPWLFTKPGKETAKVWKLLCCLLFCNSTFAQTNLVPNPSFEQYTKCPDNSNIQLTLNSKPDIWYKPDSRGAGYYNACATVGQLNVPYSGFGFQNAKTGFAYVGMFYRNGNSNNYFQVKLFDSLKIGKLYYGEYYVNVENIMKLGCNNIGMLFTDTVRYADTSNGKCIMPANPQITNYGNPIITDTLNWIKVSGIFKAKGGEQYLTLGNFKDNASTAFTIIQPTGYNGAGYYVDDVAVYALDSFCLKADAGKDTAITLGDSVFIGSYTNGIDSVKWFNSNTVIDSLRPGFWVHPAVTTSYILQQVVNGCFSADTVVVTVGTLPLKFTNCELRFKNGSGQFPSGGGVRGGFVENIWQTANEVNVSHFNIQRSINGREFITIGKVSANNKSYNEYKFIDDGQRSTVDGGLSSIYYRIESIDNDGRKQYSTIQQINFQHPTCNIVLYPNPAKNNLTIECKGMKEFNIVNSLGVEISRQEPRNDVAVVNVKGFAKGFYIIKVVTANAGTIISKFVKE